MIILSKEAESNNRSLIEKILSCGSIMAKRKPRRRNSSVFPVLFSENSWKTRNILSQPKICIFHINIIIYYINIYNNVHKIQPYTLLLDLALCTSDEFHHDKKYHPTNRKSRTFYSSMDGYRYQTNYLLTFPNHYPPSLYPI